MDTPAKIVAILTANPGQAQALETLLRDMVLPSRAEPGNLRWDVWTDPTVPGRFILDELYRDAKALDAHRGSDHFKHYRSVVTTLAEREAYVVQPLDIGPLGHSER